MSAVSYELKYMHISMLRRNWLSPFAALVSYEMPCCPCGLKASLTWLKLPHPHTDGQPWGSH